MNKIEIRLTKISGEKKRVRVKVHGKGKGYSRYLQRYLQSSKASQIWQILKPMRPETYQKRITTKQVEGSYAILLILNQPARILGIFFNFPTPSSSLPQPDAASVKSGNRNYSETPDMFSDKSNSQLVDKDILYSESLKFFRQLSKFHKRTLI